jgi:hypothetical protein
LQEFPAHPLSSTSFRENQFVSRLPWGLLLWVGVSGCAALAPPAPQASASNHLVEAARAKLANRPPSYSLRDDQADAMPQGSRCVIETNDVDPVRVVTGTVLRFDGATVVLRDGVERRLSRDWELAAMTGDQREADRHRMQERTFAELRLPLNEIRGVDVYLNAEQSNWTRMDDGWQPAGQRQRQQRSEAASREP